ncbi:MAG: bifunctional nuclease family protein [bacterium]|nr:bifunctional nuclease family protein [bacterium]
MSPRSPRQPILAALLPVLVLALCSCTVLIDDDPPQSRRVDVVGVDLDPTTGNPILRLRERGGLQRELPIWIGEAEALSIALATEGIPIPRPNTHDLIASLLDGLDGQLSRVLVTELRGSTYYATIEITVDGQQIEVDSRPSDAIAVAIRAGTPIYASEELLRADDPIPDDEDAIDVHWRSAGPPAKTPIRRFEKTQSQPTA